jgi:chemotaxis family two-component system response regulator PixH
MDCSTAIRIMVIGGDSHFNYLLRRYVRMSAHTVIQANLCEEAVLIAQREQPVAIILEIGQPDSLGWNVFQALRSLPETAQIPIILCSWQDETRAAIPNHSGLAAGVNVFLRMPILYADFTSALAEIGLP